MTDELKILLSDIADYLRTMPSSSMDPRSQRLEASIRKVLDASKMVVDEVSHAGNCQLINFDGGTCNCGAARVTEEIERLTKRVEDMHAINAMLGHWYERAYEKLKASGIDPDGEGPLCDLAEDMMSTLLCWFNGENFKKIRIYKHEVARADAAEAEVVRLRAELQDFEADTSCEDRVETLEATIRQAIDCCTSAAAKRAPSTALESLAQDLRWSLSRPPSTETKP